MVAALCATLLAPAQAVGQAVVVRDARGVNVSLREPPRRIVSLSPSVTEILFAIGAGPRVVGVTTFCDYPQQARKLPKVGDFSVSAEKVIALRPDLVIGDVEANRRAIVDLEKLRPLKGRLFTTKGKDFRSIMEALRTVGHITGERRRAETVVASMQATLDKVRSKVPRKRHRPRTVFVVQRDPLWVAGARSFVDDLIEAAGGDNVGRRAGAGYRSFGLERLIALDPEVILSTDATLSELRSRAVWKTLRAVRSGRVHVLGYDAVRPGPRLADAVLRVSRLLHP